MNFYFIILLLYYKKCMDTVKLRYMGKKGKQ